MKNFRRCLSLLVAFTIMLSMVYFAPASHAASASDYISSRYWTNLRVKATQEVALRLGPTDYTSAVYTLPSGSILPVREMVYNIYGYYWYEVEYYGQTLYCWSGYVTPVEQIVDDITLTNHVTPYSLAYGDEFYIEGDISSVYNRIESVTVSLYRDTDCTKGAIASATESVKGSSYSLTDSSIAGTIPFSSLAPGVYTYILSVEAMTAYYNSGYTTTTKTVILDRHTLVITNYENPNKALTTGIDVSEENGTIDWTEAQEDIDFAILRISEGTTLDSQFHANVQGCIDNDIPYGVYIYSLATSQAEAITEARYVLNTLAAFNYTPQLPVWFGMADSVQAALSNTLKQTVVQSFRDTVENYGYQVGLYSDLSWFYNYFNDNYYKTMPKWVTQVEELTDDGTCIYEGGTWMHQYTWNGRVSGISGDVNCNYCYFPYTEIEDTVSFLSECTYYPTRVSGTCNSPVNIRQFPSTDYAAVSSYEEDDAVEITGIYMTPGGNYWYQVVQGAIRGFSHSSWIDTDEVLFNDITVTNPHINSTLSVFEHPEVRGIVRSQYSIIGQLTANVYTGEELHSAPAITESVDVNAREYNLINSALMNSVRFESLVTGHYTLELVATVTNYSAVSGTLYTHTQEVILFTSPFTVGDAEIAPSSCTHTPVEDAAVAATCSSTGATKGSHCSTCGLVISVQSETAALAHTFEGTTCSVCGAECTHSYVSGVCSICKNICAHNYVNGVCSICSISCKHIYTDGVCTLCGKVCGHNYANGVCFVCGNVCQHTFSSGVCTSCGTLCGHSYEGSICSICGYACQHDYLDSICNICGNECTHNYVNDFCTDCGMERPDYYLFGYINGNNYACEEDAENTGEYLFVDGTLTVTFTENSYVAVKLGDNSVWYMTDGWLGEAATSAVLYNVDDLNDSANKLFVPGNREVVFTLVANSDGSLTLSYIITACMHNWDDGTCTLCGEFCTHDWSEHTCTVCGKVVSIPELTLKYYSVSFDGEVCYNIYYTGTGLEEVALENMGLLTWISPQTAGTIDTALGIIPGALTDGTLYMVHSDGIAAKNLGDNLYFKIYAQLADGTYVYSDLKSINAKNYAVGQLANSTDSYMKSLSVAMLNYGAAAQTYFNYKAYSLMNASLTDVQKALVAAYDSSMVSEPVTVSSTKGANFSNTGFSSRYATASFDGAFSLNYYFTTSYVPDGDVTLYYWDLETYNSVSVLTKANATGTQTMVSTGTDNQYWGNVAGIAAKELDQTVFVTAVYTCNGVEYASSIISYSMGRYCKRLAADDTSDQQELAQATAVYGYYAKLYFANLYGQS